MRKTKKVVALLMITVLAVTSLSLAGCGKKQRETITLDVYSQTANYSGLQSGWFGKILLDKFNVKLNIINDSEGVYVTRSESGDLGDIIIFGNDAGQYIDSVNNGLLYDWNEDDLLANEGSYINENMKKALEKNMKLNPDGKVHGYGYNVATSAEDHASYMYHPDIRWDLYKQLNYPKVGTLEDYIDLLAQMKEICPTSDAGTETYGVSLFNDWDGNMVMFVKSTAGLYGYEEFGIGLYDVSTQTWQDCLAENSIYLRCLKFYNTLYQKGLVDPDSLTQKWDGAQQDYSGGVAFFTIFNYLGSAQYNTEEHLNAGKAMYPLAAEDAKTLNNGLNLFGSNRVWAIGATTQYPEVCMEIINWLATPEGHMINLYGPKGLLWDYDENKKPFFTELGTLCRQNADTELTGDGYSGTYRDGTNQLNNLAWAADASNPDSNGATYNYLNWASWQESQKYAILDDWRAFTKFTTFDEYLDSRNHVIAPGTTYSEAKRSDEMEVKWQQVSQAIRDYSWNAIYAANDAEFDSYVQEMRDVAAGYGYEDVCQFYRDEAAKRKAAEDETKN
jgi:multiple sugar transport system substrate-binding protein/putative aldouronate transport system substrate-binding protein